MADCQRCPTTVVAMANSLISHNKNRDPRQLKPIDAKGKGDVHIVQLTNPSIEAKWIGAKVKELLDGGVQPSEIIVLVQRKRAARVILNALKAAEVSAKSYYEESQLETDEAQKRFAVFKLLLNKKDRVALRYLLGFDSTNFRAPAYARVREHCENSGDTLPGRRGQHRGIARARTVGGRGGGKCRGIVRRDDEGDHAARHSAGSEGSAGDEPAQEQGLEFTLRIHCAVRARCAAASLGKGNAEGGG
jgi:hypothetical protein